MTDQEQNRPALLDVLRAGPLGVASKRESDEARDRIMPWLEDQVTALPAQRAKAIQSERHRHLRKLTAAALGLAAAAGTVAYFASTSHDFSNENKATEQATRSLVPSPADDFATLISGRVQSGTLDVLAGSRLGLFSQVTTSEHEDAKLKGQGGYEVHLGPSSSFAFKGQFPSPPGQTRVRLDAGHAEFSVPQLAPGHSFVVETSGAEVRVVGTTFSVSQAHGSGTCVRVSEGSVAVSSANDSALLKPGQSWGCETNAAIDSPDLLDSKTASTRPAAPRPVSVRSTTLAQENALLSRALSAESKGDKNAARKAFLQLIQRYPHSPFVTDAQAGLSRISTPLP